MLILVTALLVLGGAILNSGKKAGAPKERAHAKRRGAPSRQGKPKAALPKRSPASARKPEMHPAPPQVDLSNLLPA